MTKALLSLGIAVGLLTTPVVQAQSVVANFKAELAAKLLNKKNNGAAKVAYKTVAKYVTANKGDPRKILNFTKLAWKALKKQITSDASWGKSLQFWDKFVPIKYFKQGIKNFNPNDAKFKKALAFVTKKLPKSQKTPAVINRAFKELTKLNNKLGNSSAESLYVLAEEQYGAANLPNPIPPPVS